MIRYVIDDCIRLAARFQFVGMAWKLTTNCVDCIDQKIVIWTLNRASGRAVASDNAWMIALAFGWVSKTRF